MDYMKSFALFVLMFILTGCGADGTNNEAAEGGGATPDDSESKNIAPTLIMGSNIAAFEGDTVKLIAQASDENNDNLTYAWSQVSGTPITFTDSSDSPSFVAPNLDTEEIFEFALTISDGNGGVVSGNMLIRVKAYQLSVNVPNVVGSNCTASIAVSENTGAEISNLNWEALDADGHVILNPMQIEGSPIIPLTMPSSGQYTLNVIAEFSNGSTANSSADFISVPSLPENIKSTDYIVSAGEEVVVCQDTSIWSNAKLTIEPGATLSSSSGVKILMWGDVDFLGEAGNRIEIINVKFENDFFSTNTAVDINANYVDFLGAASINNDDGVTNVFHSTFATKFYQQDRGVISYSKFHMGMSIEADGATIIHNDIYCQGLSSCISFDSYMFGNGHLNAKPEIKNNNIFNSAEDSIAYDNDSFTNSDIDVKENYWGGKSDAELSDVFVDANDQPGLSHVFLFDPVLMNEVDHNISVP